MFFVLVPFLKRFPHIIIHLAMNVEKGGGALMGITLPNLKHSFICCVPVPVPVPVPFPFPDSGFRIPDSGFRIPDSGFRILDFHVFHTPLETLKYLLFGHNFRITYVSLFMYIHFATPCIKISFLLLVDSYKRSC